MTTHLHRARTVAVLGAGCAGTLLAAGLRRRKYSGRVELFDARTDFTREQRWCFWRDRAKGKCDFPVSAEWPAWQVADDRQTVRRDASSFIYSHVYAPQFFGRFHGQLAEDAQVNLHLGCQVLSVEKASGGTYRVQTSRGELSADVVIDARHEGAPAYQRATTDAPGLLWQTFRGRVVEFADSRFDPAAVTLMDFRVPAAGAGLAFTYVLPFSATRALVEAVVLGRTRASAATLDAILDAYLDERFGAGGETLAIEEGALPMTGCSFVAPAAGATINLGVGGGAARPSSGYAFANTLRAARETAAALCGGLPLWQPTFAWKYRALDTIFLRLLDTDPAAARRAFMSMFTRVEPDRLVRFLTEASAWPDDVALALALPKFAFLRAAFSSPMIGPQAQSRSAFCRATLPSDELSIPSEGN